MVSTQTRIPDEERTYGLWSKPRREGMFGLTYATTIAIFVAIVVGLLTTIVLGPAVSVRLIVLEVLLLIPAMWRSEGRSGYEKGLIMAQWLRYVWRKKNIHAGGMFSELGSCRLPGLLADSTLYEFIDASGLPFGMLHYKGHDFYTVLLRCWPQGARAVDQDTINQWVACWGQFLASLGGQPDVEAIVPVIDCRPETGNRLAAEVDFITDDDAPEMARKVMEELKSTLPTGTVKIDPWCSITFRATTPARRKNPAEQAVEIGRRLPGIVSALSEAGVRALPMTGMEVTALVRRAWDAAAESDLEEAADSRQSHEIDWDDAGPMSVEEHRTHLWHDGVTSVTWEMKVAPEGYVRERVLQRLLEPNPDVPRKRIAIIYRPHSADAATTIVDDDYKDALTAVNASARSNLGSAHADVRVQAAQLAREEQARGHGVTRFSILITITEPDNGQDVPSMDAIARSLSIQARLKIRRCHRFQSAAFAAGLGVGVLLPEMATVPRVVSA